MAAEAEAVEQARATEDEKTTEDVETELAQALAEEEATEAAEETAVEKSLRKKAATTNKKTIASSVELDDPSDDIYFAAFHVGASLEMLGDPAQLEAWWHK